MVLTAPDSKCHMDSEGAQSLLVTAMRRDTVTANLIDEPCHEDRELWVVIVCNLMVHRSYFWVSTNTPGEFSQGKGV